MMCSKKILLAVLLAVSAGGSAYGKSGDWSYIYHEPTLQYIYLVGNPSYTGSEPYDPASYIIAGDPSMANPFTLVTDTKSGLSTLSFITILQDGTGAPVETTRRLCLARLADGTVGLKNISAAGSAAADPSCLWKVIDDGLDATNVPHSRVLVPGTDSAPQYLTFDDGLSVQSGLNMTSAQFRMGQDGTTPLLYVDGYDGLTNVPDRNQVTGSASATVVK